MGVFQFYTNNGEVKQLPYNARLHYFENTVSLCSKYYQAVDDADVVEDTEALERPAVICKICLAQYRRHIASPEPLTANQVGREAIRRLRKSGQVIDKYRSAELYKAAETIKLFDTKDYKASDEELIAYVMAIGESRLVRG